MNLPIPKTHFMKIIASMATVLVVLVLVVVFLLIARGNEEYSPAKLIYFENGTPHSVVQNYIIFFNSGNLADLKNSHDLLTLKNQSFCPFDDFRYINNQRDSEKEIRLSYPKEEEYISSNPKKAYVTVEIEYTNINQGFLFFSSIDRYSSTYEFELIKQNNNWRISTLPDYFGLPRADSNAINCRS